MAHDTVTADSAWTACREEPTAELIELGRLRSERSLIEAARDYYYHRWLADEEFIGRLRLRVKHLEATLTRIEGEESSVHRKDDLEPRERPPTLPATFDKSMRAAGRGAVEYLSSTKNSGAAPAPRATFRRSAT